ncbi:MAG: tol-pal system protein YbgF [Nitrospiraceae bacterium]|nr:tol-pal system protein YbgF [Nitrospiraceae bacterium]
MKSIKETKQPVILKAARLFIVILLPILLIHCAPQDQVNMLERQVNGLSVENRSLNNQVEALRQEIKALEESTKKIGKKDIASVRMRQADFSNRMDELKAELLRLNGLIDQMGHKSDQDEKDALAFRQDIKGQIEKLKEDIKLLQASVEVTKKVEKAREMAARGEVDLYQQALNLVQKKRFKDAERTLKTYIERHPQGKRIANAYFWIGECEYNIKHYEEAILGYQKVISSYPKSNKVAAALLKQGLAFVRLGDKESAKIVLKKLLKRYPRTSQAKVAKKQLKRLK